MCDVVGKAMSYVPEASRRRFLGGAGAMAALGGLALAGCSAPEDARSEPEGSAGKGVAASQRTNLVLLGTAGGPTVLTDERYGISTAVTYGDKVYIVDLGHGSHMRLLGAGVGGEGFGGTSMARIRGIFFTHLHSDHVVEWPAVYATAGMNSVDRKSVV